MCVLVWLGKTKDFEQENNTQKKERDGIVVKEILSSIKLLKQ